MKRFSVVTALLVVISFGNNPANAQALTFPSAVDTFRAGDTVRVALRAFLAEGDAPVDNLTLVGENPAGSIVQGDTLIWVVPDTARGTQTFRVIARDALGNTSSGKFMAFVRYRPAAPSLRFVGNYTPGDILTLLPGKTDSVMVELLGVDPRDRPLIRLEWDSTVINHFNVSVDTVGGTEMPTFNVRFAPIRADTSK